MRFLYFLTIVILFFCSNVHAGIFHIQRSNYRTDTSLKNQKVFYGKASYYGDKFNGRKTASGEIFSQKKFTAACNILPLGTWIRVTNLKNNKSVIVKTNDRLHPKMKRVVDLSRIAAENLGFIRGGIAKVKVEVVKPHTKK